MRIKLCFSLNCFSIFVCVKRNKDALFAWIIVMFSKKISRKVSTKVTSTVKMRNVIKAVVFTIIHLYNLIISRQFFIVRFHYEYFSWSKNLKIFSMLFTTKLNDLFVMIYVEIILNLNWRNCLQIFNLCKNENKCRIWFVCENVLIFWNLRKSFYSRSFHSFIDAILQSLLE